MNGYAGISEPMSAVICAERVGERGADGYFDPLYRFQQMHAEFTVEIRDIHNILEAGIG